MNVRWRAAWHDKSSQGNDMDMGEEAIMRPAITMGGTKAQLDKAAGRNSILRIMEIVSFLFSSTKGV